MADAPEKKENYKWLMKIWDGVVECEGCEEEEEARGGWTMQNKMHSKDMWEVQGTGGMEAGRRGTRKNELSEETDDVPSMSMNPLN